MTYQDVLSAVQAELEQLWPKRKVYVDFCPVNHKRPSSFLYAKKVSYEGMTLGSVEWTLEAEIRLYAERDVYDAVSAQALRNDQLSILSRFPGPDFQVGKEFVTCEAQGESPGPGEAYVLLRLSWVGTRNDGAGETVPMAENFELNQTDMTSTVKGGDTHGDQYSAAIPHD